MKASARLVCLIGLAAALSLGAFLFFRKGPADTGQPETSVDPITLINAPAATLPPEEIFRRAFWRQPSADDRILHAERRETIADSSAPGERSITGWQWFLAVRPSDELLRSLRDPETFGLLRAPSDASLLPLPTDPQPAPDWFPLSSQTSGMEILRNPGTRLVVVYDAKEDVLFATDSGAGFAAPAR